MRGCIRKRGVGYQIIVDLGRDSEGKRKQKAIGGFKKIKDAKKALAEMIAKVENGQVSFSKEMSMEEYLNKWLQDYAKINVAPKTYKSYESTIRLYIIPYIGNIKLNQLRPAHLQEMYSKNSTNGLSNTSVLYIHRVVHIALSHALKWQLIFSNPADAVDAPKKDKRQINILLPEQLKLLLQHIAGTHLYIPVLLAIITGMRRGEILGLNWTNVDFINNVIYVDEQLQRINGELTLRATKTHGSKRSIAIPPSFIPELKAIQKYKIKEREDMGFKFSDTQLICSWPDGQPYDPDYVTHKFKKVIKELELPDARFHDLRHTYATLWLKAGGNMKVLSGLLGHSTYNLTADTYSHVLPEMQYEGVKKLDNILSFNKKGKENNVSDKA